MNANAPTRCLAGNPGLMRTSQSIFLGTETQMAGVLFELPQKRPVNSGIRNVHEPMPSRSMAYLLRRTLLKLIPTEDLIVLQNVKNGGQKRTSAYQQRGSAFDVSEYKITLAKGVGPTAGRANTGTGIAPARHTVFIPNFAAVPIRSTADTEAVLAATRDCIIVRSKRSRSPHCCCGPKQKTKSRVRPKTRPLG